MEKEIENLTMFLAFVQDNFTEVQDDLYIDSEFGENYTREQVVRKYLNQ